MTRPQPAADRPGCVPGTDPGKILDLTRLLEGVGNDKGLLVEMLTIFEEECPKLMSEIGLAVANNDPDNLRTSAHSSKRDGRRPWCRLCR